MMRFKRTDLYTLPLLVYIIYHLKKSMAFTSCGISILTVNYVKQCPEDSKSWQMAAKRMDCDGIEQDCQQGIRADSHQFVFQYHCVINVWRNATLEVCAFNRTLLGYCAEFNILGSVIQDNYYADCTKHDPPCPSVYNSAEAYKYQSCYKLVEQNERNTKIISAAKRTSGNLTTPFISIFFRFIIRKLLHI
uniref:Uncharacterized protein n=4 Tax=Magallana gigas TaxID=29159 RepID=A0A8W8JKW3_MAGGI|nr:uncharacterized protein LOC117690690 [Crassostrea gigas]XP_034331053.1 uncharacterized protein LOC117690691 isoform X2 [Crassostrea gigas]